VPDTYDEPPSALEALRMVAKGHPAVIHGGFLGRSYLTEGFSPMKAEHDWRALETYNALHSGDVTIAVTDDGLADSVRTHNGESLFVKPLEVQMPMAEFLAQLADKDSKEVLYLQSQDGNIFRSEPGPRGSPELATFQGFVARDIEWMREATGNSAEAVNLWIGTKQSTTSFHHDPCVHPWLR
jgi:jumonji domain-containing protein 7